MQRIILFCFILSAIVYAQVPDSVYLQMTVKNQIESARAKERLAQIKKDSLDEINSKEAAGFGISQLQSNGSKNPDSNTATADAVINQGKMSNTSTRVNSDLITSAKVEKNATNNSTGSIWKLYFLGGISIFAFSFVYIRRRQTNQPVSKAKLNNKNLKNNIRILRDESIVKREIPELKVVRAKLVNSPVVLNNHGKSLPTVARELNIAQGEIILAARLKSYELAKNDKEKWYLN